MKRTMKTKTHTSHTKEIVEIITDEVLIKTPQDINTLVEDNYTAEYFILHTHNFEDKFFDLSTLILGETMQKLSNYNLKLAIVGDFNRYPSKILQSFIYESNKQKDYLFVSSVDDVLKIW
jgi:hypothetical protein